MALKNKDKTSKIPKGPRAWRWSNFLHLALNIALPLSLLALVRLDLIPLAIIVALFSKWRVFAVRPRHLLTNLRANFTDIFVKLGTLVFIINSETFAAQLAWTMWYILWLSWIKPKSSKTWMGIQALAGQFIGLSALFQFSETMPQIILLVLVWLVAAGTARHFLSNYEYEWTDVVVLLWGLFVTQMAWLAYRWLLIYLFVPQLVLILALLSYTAASMYDAWQSDKLKPGFIRQQTIVALIALAAILILGDWQGEI